MQLQKDSTEIVSRVFDLAKVPVEIRASVREQATKEVLQICNRIIIASKLSERDVEILEMLSKGHTTKDISKKVFLSYRTIESRMTALKGIMACRNIHHLIGTAKDLKII